MAETKNTTPTVSVPSDHDRVVMLSLKADGTPDQTNPEIIGDKDVAIEAAKEQFGQKAAAAVDAELRSLEDPPSAEEITKATDKAVAAAEKQAEAVVNELHKG